jgi:elongation factor 1-beta
MGSYVIRLKVLPEDTTTEHQKIVESVAKALPAGAEIKGQRIEPIAFGLSAIILDIVTPEEDGVVDRVEHSISNAPLVGQYELIGVSKMSSRIHMS